VRVIKALTSGARMLMWRFSVVNRRGGVLEGKEGFKYTL
jgi:hypothetical protein